MKARTFKALEKRRENFMPGGIPRKIRIYDNGGASFDRYTVVYTGNYRRTPRCQHQYVGMSENPFHPQGFGQHGESDDVIDYPSYKHLGKKIKWEDLPPNCQKLVIQDYMEIWQLHDPRVDPEPLSENDDGQYAHLAAKLAQESSPSYPQ